MLTGYGGRRWFTGPVRAAVFLLGSLLPAWAQGPQFEVATIKPSPAEARGTTLYNPTTDRFAASYITVKGLIAYAYDVRQFQISGGPGWMSTDPYDVVAKPDGDIGGDRVRAMVRGLLADRLGLKLHRESREMPVLALVVAKGGPKLQATAGNGPDVRGGSGQLTAHKITIGMMAEFLGEKVGRPLVDRTGITGEFDMELDWTPEDSPDTGPSLATVLQEQLGLRLEAQRGPVEMLVVDSVERPSEN